MYDYNNYVSYMMYMHNYNRYVIPEMYRWSLCDSLEGFPLSTLLHNIINYYHLHTLLLSVFVKR